MDLAKTLRNQAKNNAIFYVTLDPERALGLEDILPNYTIVCPYKSRLTEKLKRQPYTHDREQKVKFIVLEEELAEREVEKIVQRGTYGILSGCARSREARRSGIIPRNSYIMVLKNSELIENFCKRHGWNLIAPKAKIAGQFENKISQYRLLKNVVPYPKSVIAILKSQKRFASLTGGKAIVLQFNRGHSGNTTFFLKSKGDLENLAKKFPKREAKISEYIKGKTYTLNCLVLRNGEVITGSLSEQITGLKGATNNPNTTCGNDFVAPRKLKTTQIKKVRDISQNVGMALYKKGYRGLFGIDVIISESRPALPAGRQAGRQGTHKVYFIEVNTHQPASISFEAKIHRKIGKVPLLAYFILDCVSVAGGGGIYHPCLPAGRPLPSFVRRGRPPLILPISARQIIYRNKTSKILTLSDIERKYKGKGLISRMKYVKPNEEIFRKQFVK